MKDNYSESILQIINFDELCEWDFGLFNSLSLQGIWERKRAGLKEG